MDYTNLNEACPMDSFPLPRINKIVDASARHGMPSFLFSGHHKIQCTCLMLRKRPSLCHTAMLLQHDAFWFEECRGNLLETRN